MGFDEFQDEIIEKKHEQRKESKRKLKEDFFTMLRECSEVKPGVRFHRIVPFLENDPRWKAVRYSEDGERWTHDVLDKMKQERLERRRAASQKLKELVIGTKEISHSTSYHEFQKMFQDNEIYTTKELSGE